MKRSTTKRALLMSGLAMLLSISMLVGTTFAWFTDSVSSANNIIKSGNLDIELEYWNGTEWVDVEKKSDILTNTLWEPGVTEVAYLRVANAGSLALKYQLGINIVSETAGVNKEGKEFKLSDYIQFGVVEGIAVNAETKEPTTYATREAAVAAVTGAKKISAGYTKAEAMAAGEELYLALVVYMPTTVGNEANHNGTNVPKIDLGINIFATQATAEEDSFDEYYDGGAKWLGGIDTSWYNANDTEFVIGNPEQLAGLAQLVNTGVDSFSGKTVKLASDLDLNNINWTPIGSFDYDRDAQAYANAVTFKGIFDGQGHTINNLKINTPTTEGAALFGCVEAATIKNVNVHNVDIVAGGHAAAILARGYNYSKTTTVTNCHVTGDIDILIDWAYAGGIVAKATGLNISECSVKPTETGVITASNRNAVGGIVGWVEAVGASTISNCQVANMELTGWANIGSINGYVQAGCTIDNCSAENIVLTKTRVDGHPTIGLVAGGFSYNATQPVTITNNTVKNITLNGTHIAAPASANILYGAEFSGNANSNFVLDNNTTENVNNNLVEIVAVKDAAGLKAALANGGDNYVLTKDIVVGKNETITVANGTTVVVDLNGYTISSTADKTGNQELFLVKGNLTVKNGSIEYAASNNQGWGSMITIFDVTAGGAITLDEVKASVYGSDMNFVAHLNNWGSASAVITNCKFDLSYVAVRAFNSGNDMNTVTIKNTNVIGGARLFWVHNYTAEGKDDTTLTLDIYNNGNTCGNAKPVRFGFDNESYYTLDGKKMVSTADELVATLKDGKDVVLNNDLTDVAVNTTAPYGNKYGIALNGGVIDGNGNDLIFNSNSGDHYGIMTSGGTIKNVNIGGAFRGIMIMNPTADVVIDNVVIDNEDVCYAVNTGEGDGTRSISISNSTLKGWTSIGNTVKEVSFTNCTFGQGTYYTNVYGRLVKPYVNATFSNCDFSSKYYIDLSALAADQKIVLENCTVNGVKLTAENWTTLLATESACGEGQISIELRDGSYMTAENVADYVIIK